MSPRTARGDRLGLGLTGLLLLAAGVAVLSRHQDAGAVLTQDVRERAASSSATWPVVLAVAVVVALLCLRWLLVGARPPGPARLRLQEDLRAGETVLRAGAVDAAVAASAEQIPGVRSARAHLVGGRGGRRHLRLQLVVDRDADVPSVVDAAAGTVLAGARTALEQPDLGAQVLVRAASGRPGRARRQRVT